MGRFACVVAVLAVAVACNFHYALLGSSALTGLMGSSAIVGVGNGLWRLTTVRALKAEGLEVGGARTEYVRTGPDGTRLLVDVYEPRAAGAGRPAVVYFHAGAYAQGFKEFAAGTLGLLALEGFVGVSVGYRLTSERGGAGLAGCVDDARAALAWVRARSAALGVDPEKVVAMGDSAGGHLALLLALDDASPPAAVVAGWPVASVEPRHWLTRCAREKRFFGRDCGAWEDSPAAADLDGSAAANVFLPRGDAARATADATRAHLEDVTAGAFLLYGRRARGWLPPAFNATAAAALSPLAVLEAAPKRKRPPALVFAAADDTVVPYGQQRRFAETYRKRGGGAAALVVFEGADHGGGGLNCAAGRDALRDFLRGVGLAAASSPAAASDADELARGGHLVEKAQRGLGVDSRDYPRGVFAYRRHKAATVVLAPLPDE